MTSNDNLCQDKIYDNDFPYHTKECYLNEGEEDEMEIYGYVRSPVRTIVTWIFFVLSLGILRLIFHWYRHLMLYATHRRCPLKFAQYVLVIESYQQSHKTYFVKKVKRMNLENLSLEDVEVICDDLNAESIICLPDEIGSLVRIYFNDGSFIDESDLIEIKVKKLAYIWRQDKKQFCKVAGIEKGLNKSDLHDMPGFSAQSQAFRRMVYGKNEIHIKQKSFMELIVLECLNPFYMFQVFSLTIWLIELYIYYCFAIILMSLFGILSSVIQTLQNQKQLYKTVKTDGIVTVRRNAGNSKTRTCYEDVHVSDLVPGDIIVIPRTGFTVPCDAILLCGNCIVNESMLTGESVPVTKTPLPCLNIPYNEKEDANHTLFCGTDVLQARYYANENIHAVVLRTGYLTAKGNLVRSILYPVPHDFKFDQDVYRFVWILGIIAFLGSVYTIFTKVKNGADFFLTVTDSLDIITIVVPPALPAAMSVGKYYAQRRLKKQKISCMNTSVINVSGSINCICFDKTGTLTEDGMDLYGVIPVKNQQMGELITNVRDSTLTNLKEGMASCHSLTLINNVISGDPLDVKMFECTGWILDETDLIDTLKYDILAPTIVKSSDENREIGIIHQFQFSSHLQRMSVITRHLDSKLFTVYCKGSPEMIESLSETESVPKNLHAVLEKQTEKGYRVIAVGYRTFPAIDIIKLKRLHRNEVECNLIFAGLIIFENKLKSQTTFIISDLKQANMKIVMLTGDNIQTAICVAKECGIINKSELLVTLNAIENIGVFHPKLSYTINNDDSSILKTTPSSNIFSITDVEMGTREKNNYRYALTGHTWNIIRESVPSSIPNVLASGVIFARMSADQKQQVIQELQNLGFYVAMCGDGANDCGALKTADVGISLSEMESSVASPFTSHQSDISCVPKVIKEGRAALLSAFGIFKFMVLYSLLEFFSTVLLFSVDDRLTDFEYLYIDVFLIVIFAFFFGQTKAYSGSLVPNAPSSSLLSMIPISSLIIQISVMACVQLLSIFIVNKFPRCASNQLRQVENENHDYNNYAVYTVSQFQYIILAVIFSYGKPYREPIHKNAGFFLSLIVMTSISIYITMYPSKFVENLFEFQLPPNMEFRLTVMGLAVGNFVLSLFLESFVVNSVLVNILNDKNRKKMERNYFKDNNNKWSNKINASIEHISESGVKCYGTMKTA